MWFERTKLLLGQDKYQLLNEKHVLIVGLGGVGSFAAEFLTRAGIGKLTIVDPDLVQPSNINRQIQALHSTVGKKKAFVLAQRLLDINPDLHLKALDYFLHEQEIEQILSMDKYDYVVDAIDTFTPKLLLIQKTVQAKFPLISSLGTGGRLDPTQIRISDISESYGDKLGRQLRKKLHKFGIYSGFKVVFSPEPRRPESLLYVDERNKKTTLGTISYIPAVFGAFCAYGVIKDLAGL